jgi:hypothetical protein
MKLKLDITPDLVAAMAAEVKAGEKAVTAAMREAGTGLKTAWRGQITGAGLGRRLANSIRSQTYPEGRREPERRGAGLVQGPGHRRRARHRPADPLEERVLAGDPDRGRGQGLRGGKITPGEWERRRGLRLRFVYRAAGPSLLVAEGRLNTNGSGGGVALEDRPRPGHRADLPAGPAGQAAEAARSRRGTPSGRSTACRG